MSDLFDKLNEKTNGWLKNARDKAVDLGKQGMSFAESTIEKGKDKAQEIKLNSQLRDAFAKLGEAFYENSVSGAEFADKDELFASITSIKQTLADLADKMAGAAEKVEEAVETAEETVEEAVEEATEE